ncbi:MAG: flagellar hook-basal body complex protein [Stappiaceae bacterium]
MSIYGAINSATSGLEAQSIALENISGNIANSQSIGFKGLNTTFSDLVASTGATQADQVSGTTYATSRATNEVQGDIQSADVETYMAIDGEGYFVVTAADGQLDGTTVFSEEEYYTRAGDFDLTEDGYLLNQAGYYLMGYAIDPATGNAVGNEPNVIQITDDLMQASASTIIEYQGNLPSYPQTSNADTTVAGSQYLDTTSSVTLTAVSDVSADDTDYFLDSSIGGESITLYDANGTPANVQIRWAQTADDQWNAYYQTDSAATGAATAWTNVGSVTFDAAGEVLTPATGTLTITGLSVNGTTVGDVDINFSNGALSQYDDVTGLAKIQNIDQNGFPSGEVTAIAIGEDGRITATYSNEQTEDLYEIPLATFAADYALQRVDGAAFAVTPASGAPQYESGSVVAGALEASNVDIADEFSKLIITQQAYSANSKIITAADEMLDDAINMVR